MTSECVQAKDKNNSVGERQLLGVGVLKIEAILLQISGNSRSDVKGFFVICFAAHLKGGG